LIDSRIALASDAALFISPSARSIRRRAIEVFFAVAVRPGAVWCRVLCGSVSRSSGAWRRSRRPDAASS
jgi:hypothetical protein